MTVRLIGYGNPRIALVPTRHDLARYTPTFARASMGTYWDSAGVLQTAAVNTPRVGYDPVSHAMRGLLVESAFTNLLTHSGDLSNGWKLGGHTNASPLQPSPDGANNASDLIQAAASWGAYEQFAEQDLGALAGVWTLGALFSPAPEVYGSITAVHVGDGGVDYGYFDLAGDLIRVAPFGKVIWSTLASVGAGWLAGAVSFSTDSSCTSLRGRFNLSDAYGSVTFTGDGVSALRVFAPFLIDAPYAKSLFLTGASSAGPASDIATLNAAWSSKTTGSLLCTFTPEWDQSLLASEVVLASQVFDSGDYFALTADASNVYAVLSVGGTVFRAPVAASLSMLTEHWAFASFDDSVLKLTLDGGTIANTATGTTPSGTPTEFGLGSLNGAQQADSWLRNLYYGKSAATDAAMLAAATTGLYPLILDGALQGVTA